MPSSRQKPSARRQIFLKLSSQIEGQLREAYAVKNARGEINQSELALKLDVNRSAIHHRLTGRTNMTIKTIADMVWGLEQDIEVKIFDRSATKGNYAPLSDPRPVAAQSLPTQKQTASNVAIPTSNSSLGGVSVVYPPFSTTAAS